MGGAWDVGQACHSLALLLVPDEPVRMVAVLHAIHQLMKHGALVEMELGNFTLLVVVDVQIAVLACGILKVMKVCIVCDPCPCHLMHDHILAQPQVYQQH
jgi:hypothetical protein